MRRSCKAGWMDDGWAGVNACVWGVCGRGGGETCECTTVTACARPLWSWSPPRRHLLQVHSLQAARYHTLHLLPHAVAPPAPLTHVAWLPCTRSHHIPHTTITIFRPTTPTHTHHTSPHTHHQPTHHHTHTHTHTTHTPHITPHHTPHHTTCSAPSRTCLLTHTPPSISLAPPHPAPPAPRGPAAAGCHTSGR
eukprot:350925-Chlamydomonas_euryale.AAC.2